MSDRRLSDRLLAPLRSEAAAFTLVLWTAGIAAVVCGVVLLARAL